MAFDIPNSLTIREQRLTRWRSNSPFFQTLLLGVVVFCVPGMNTVLVGLGAGGSHPSEIPTVDKINIVTGTFIAFSGVFGGCINNRLGPKYTLMLGASGYPVFVGSLWWLDQGKGPTFAYFMAVYHGVCAALFYSTAGYIATSYAPEQHRGKYVASLWFFLSAGSATGSGVVLGLTAKSSVKSSHVPSIVYISIIAIQCVGFLVSALLISPAKVRRNDGCAIAHFKPSSWREELSALPKSIIAPGILLTSLALFSCQMPYSLAGSLNAFYFNARTRALTNFCFWLSGAGGSVGFALVCDGKCFGNRRKRAMVVSIIAAALILGSSSGLLSFFATHRLNRKKKPPGVDWSDGPAFANLLPLYIFLGISSSVFQSYLMWLCSTFSNEPTILSRYSGYIEALKALGMITAFGIDSNHIAFLTEEVVYFSLNAAGLTLCVISAFAYTRDTKYGDEECVIVPKAFQCDESSISQVLGTKEMEGIVLNKREP